MSIDGIGRGRGWYVELEPMKTHWLLIWREADGGGLPHRLIVGSVYVSTNPQDTHDFQYLTTLGNIYGFITYAKTAEAYLENNPDDPRLTYEKVHESIWFRLGQRREILAKRRKKS